VSSPSNSILASLRALAVSVLTTEPALVVGVIVSVVVAVVTVAGFSVPATAITAVVSVLVGALVTRLKVTPV
jgi:hypothetical protein